MRTARLLPAALAALLALLGPDAAAQGNTTAAVSGVVLDENGPLPGATVVAVHEPSGSRYGTTSRLDGRYDLRGLRVGGPYTVTASFVGYQPTVRQGLTLTLGQIETVDFPLVEQTAALEEVVVTAEGGGAVIAQSRTGAATNVGEGEIEALPTISRSLTDFARLSPLSAGGGSSSFAGRNDRYNNLQIDGATLNDVFGLGDATPGSQAGTQPISIDAIEEFNVEVAPYDVRAGGFTGGLINAITKSGTNEFAGTLRLLGRNESLIGDFEGQDFSEFQEGTGVFTLGGPIVRDKLFFFVSGEAEVSEFPDNTGLAGSGAPNESNVTLGDVESIAGIAQSVYGYDAGGFDLITDDRSSYKALVKLDWNINENHTLSLRNNTVDADDDQGVGRGRSSFDLGNRRYVFRSFQNSAVAQLNSRFGNNASNEARLVYTAIRDERDVEDEPFPETAVFVTDEDEVGLGIGRFSQANALDQDLVEFTNNLTLFRGAHTLTLGTSNEFYGFSNLFVQDYYGSYEFTDLSLPDGLAVDTDGDGVGDVTGTLPAVDAFRLGLPTRYLFSYASDYETDADGRILFDEAGNPRRTVNPGALPRAEFTAFQLGLYAQDEWNATDRLRLTLGLRVDVPFVPEEPVDNPLVSGGTGVGPDGTAFDIEPAFVDADGEPYSTANTASGNPLFSPRLGLNFRADGLAGRPLQVRGGTGIFSGRTPFVWVSNQFSNTGADLARIDARLRAADFDRDGDGVLSGDELGFFAGSADPAAQPVPGGGNALAPETTTEINLISEDFRFPQVFRTNLGLDQELGAGFVATVEGIYTQAVNDVVYRNLNFVATDTSAYGRPIYGGRADANFTNALLLENTSEGYTYSGVVQLQRRAPAGGGLGGSLSYTLNRATNVNNGTSSRAISNFQFNENVDVNDPGLGTADFEVRHRVLGSLTYRTAYADRFTSELGLFFDTQAGEPFSWIYAGDANADGQRFNDLLYVPASEGEVFLTSENWDLLDAFIESQDGLAAYRGTFAERNTSRAPWQTRLDLEFNQGVETLRGQRVDFEVTLINLLNFLNSDWGRLQGTSFNNITALSFQRYVEDGDVGSALAGRVVTEDDLGKPVVSFNERTVRDFLTGDAFNTFDLASRWQLRFGVKYTF
jgi:hypothetical protein